MNDSAATASARSSSTVASGEARLRQHVFRSPPSPLSSSSDSIDELEIDEYNIDGKLINFKFGSENSSTSSITDVGEIAPDENVDVNNSSNGSIKRGTLNFTTKTISEEQTFQKIDARNSNTRLSKPQVFMKFLQEKQIELPIGILTVLLIANQIPSLRPYTAKFIYLQYRQHSLNSTTASNSDLYHIGNDDIYFIITWVVALTFIRAFLMDYVLYPLATFFNITKKKQIQRFIEQGWSVFYYVTSFSIGLYLYYFTPYFLNSKEIYNNWPHYELSGGFKSYYLIQLSCWFQQIFILNIEKRRKDHVQMFSHHIITIGLVSASYFYYFTRIGHVILILMDFVDIWLSAAKMLKYIGFTKACDFFFLIFLVSWIVLRHGVYNYLYYITLFDIKGGHCDDPFNNNKHIRCYTDGILNMFFILLGLLQFITIIWMVLILKVLYKVVTGKGADDIRSDDEDD